MTKVHDWAFSTKRRISRMLRSPLLGRMVARATHDRIRHHGNVIATDHPSISSETKAALFWGSYERAETSLVQRHLPPHIDAVELGSSIGVVSSHIARRLVPGQRLVCVEANPALLAQIRRNVELNAPDRKLDVVHAAVSYEHRGPTVAFAVAERNVDSRIASYEDGDAVPVPRTTLSLVIEEAGIERFGLVADIEGAEWGLIAEERDALRRCDAIVIELHPVPGVADAIESMLRQLVEIHAFTLVERRGNVCALAR